MMALDALTPEILTAANLVWRYGSEGDNYLKCKFIGYVGNVALYRVLTFIDYSNEDDDLPNSWTVSVVKVTEEPEGCLVAKNMYDASVSFGSLELAEKAFAALTIGV